MPHPIDQERLSFYTFLSVLLISLGICLVMIAPYLIAIVMGGILALLARPIYQRLLNLKLSPSVAASLVTLSVILLVVGPLLTFAAVAIRQAITFANVLAKLDPIVVRDALITFAHKLPIPSTFVADHLEGLQEYLQEGIRDGMTALASSMLDAARGIPGGILQICLACLACFFFLLDGKRFIQWLTSKIPLDYDVRERLAVSFHDTAISVVWASMAAAGAQALIMWIAYLLTGVPAAFLAGGATFIFAWIPILGSTPVWIAGVIYLAIQGSYAKLVVLFVIGLIVGVIDNFVRPLVLKGRGEMHPMVSLVAIFGGLKLLGFFGVFLGPILAAFVVTLLQIWPIVGRRLGLRVGTESALLRTENDAGGRS